MSKQSSTETLKSLWRSVMTNETVCSYIMPLQDTYHLLLLPLGPVILLT